MPVRLRDFDHHGGFGDGARQRFRCRMLQRSSPPFRAIMHLDFIIARLLALIARDVLRYATVVYIVGEV
jgi:hypothetical protein